MVRFMREKKTQVAHAFDFYTNIMLAPAARFAGVPVIVGGHRQIGDLLSPAQFRVQAMAFRFCDRVVCNSQAAATRLREAGIADKKGGRDPERATRGPVLGSSSRDSQARRMGAHRHGGADE